MEIHKRRWMGIRSSKELCGLISPLIDDKQSSVARDYLHTFENRLGAAPRTERLRLRVMLAYIY